MGEAAKHVVSASLWLLAAYAYVRLSYYRRFCVQHMERDRFALYLLGYSLVFYVGSQVVIAFIPAPVARVAEVRNLVAAGISPPVILSIFLGIASAAIENSVVALRMRADVNLIDPDCGVRDRCRLAAVGLFIRRSHDATLRTVFRAAVLKKPIMVTLKSHKVYVGKPYFPLLDDPTGDLRALKLLVSQSGYRDKNTKIVTLLTNYAVLRERLRDAPPSALGRSRNDKADPLRSDIMILLDAGNEEVSAVDLEDLGTVIAWGEVESLTIYDPQIFRVFQEQTLAALSVASAGKA
jgi:hypothetical protein